MLDDPRSLAHQAIATAHARSADPDFPRFHVAPPIGRLNDPNGLLVAAGTYHVFYQFTPLYPARKLVHWGHTSSTDLVTWTDHGPAIDPDSPHDHNGVYSGNAVITDNPEMPYVLHYTGNAKDEVTQERSATQCRVTSSDLVTFTKDPSLPVIPQQPAGYTAHFRDPQVWRDNESWLMLLGAQRDNLTGACVLYRSDDLLNWEFQGELSFPDAAGTFDSFGYMWECPNLISLTDEITGKECDILLWCPQGIYPDREGFENVFPCIYTVGKLEGTTFHNSNGSFTELDRGFEFYAPQVFARSHQDPGPVLMMGWAGNAGEDDQPSVASGGWVHTLTVPRELRLVDGKLLQQPALSVSTVPGAEVSGLPTGTLEQGNHRLAALADSRSFHICISVINDDTPWTIRLGSAGCHVDITIDRDLLTVDRSTSRYQHGNQRSVTLSSTPIRTLEILHDRSITEIFTDAGEIVFTFRSFLDLTPGLELIISNKLHVESFNARRHD
ncbi:MAG: glycoside hydrolase family 32 protein [Propionibacteriaceae bacterium]